MITLVKKTIYLLTLFTLISRINSQNPTPTSSPPQQQQKTCTIHPNNNNNTNNSSTNNDDAPSIIAAFKECGTNGRIVFLNETYHIESVMNTTGLHNCQIDIYGTLIWGTNISYWLNHSMAYGYQNQSSLWWIGGDGIRMDGHGVGTLDGNGQTWYDFVAGVSNYPNRPEALTIWNTQDSIFQGLRFIQSQMWTLTLFKTKNILLQNIYVNSTSNNHSIPARNTDGCDTIYSSNIQFKNWTVINGDDSIALKANSTNILIEDSTFINGLGVALGSIGQYLDVFEILENITVRDCSYWDTLHAGYVKTWTGERVGYPPNGGGGGLGYAKNTTFKDLTLHNTTLPFSITQCTTFSGVSGDCNSSLFQISDIVIKNISGTIKEDPITSFQCSASAPCTDFTIEDLDLWIGSVVGEEASGFNCSSLVGTTGFNCTGETCGTASSTGVC